MFSFTAIGGKIQIVANPQPIPYWEIIPGRTRFDPFAEQRMLLERLEAMKKPIQFEK